jgi:hypothetical protein
LRATERSGKKNVHLAGEAALSAENETGEAARGYDEKREAKEERHCDLPVPRRPNENLRILHRRDKVHPASLPLPRGSLRHLFSDSFSPRYPEENGAQAHALNV